MTAMQTGINQIGQFAFESLLAGYFPRASVEVTLKSGTHYPVGAVLGRVIADGKCALVDSSKSDGSEKVYGVLAEAVDATAADRTGVAFLTGEFVAQRVTFGGSDNAATHRDAARALCIFFHDAALQPNQ